MYHSNVDLLQNARLNPIAKQNPAKTKPLSPIPAGIFIIENITKPT